MPTQKKHTFTWQLFVKLLLQSALQPLWAVACSTVVEYSQQECFYRAPLPAARQTPTWRTGDYNVPTPATRCLSRLKRHERTPAAEGGTMGEKFPRILPKVATSMSLLVLLHAVNLRYGTDGFTSPLKEGALRIFSPEKSDGFGRVFVKLLYLIQWRADELFSFWS